MSDKLIHSGAPSGKDPFTLPFTERLAVRQARTVLFFAFVIGLILSFAQIINDYLGQKEALKGTLDQLTESIQKPAESAVWTLNDGLGEGVIEGLLGYEPILEVQLFEADTVLMEKKQAQPPIEAGWLIRHLFGESYALELPLFSPEGSKREQIGKILMQVDPAYAGRAFLNRSVVVVASGVARTLMLSCVLLVLFYFTLTRPVLAVSHFVRDYRPRQDQRHALNFDEKHLHGELNILYREARTLMDSVDDLNGALENKVQASTRALNLAKQSLDHVSASVMTVDEQMRVLYANPSLKRQLPILAQQAGEAYPLQHLVPERSRFVEQISVAESTHSQEVQVGEQFFTLSSTKLLPSGASHISGFTIEWRNRTEERRTEEKIRQTLSAASVGQLNQRLSLDNEQPFFHALNRDINHLLSTNEQVIRDVNQVLKAMADGDMRKQIDADYQGDFARLQDNVNTTIGKLNEVIEKIKSTADTVDQNSGAIIEANRQLADQRERLSRCLLNTVNDMDQLTHAVAQNASGVSEADSLAKDAKRKAEQGAETSSAVISAIEQLSEASQRIASITEVINGIAFQTNLLALNAAVEAARAGTSGKGFAVVATEVQSLSVRSSEAAKEISDLIRNSANRVNDCTRLVKDSEDSLGEIVNAAHQVSHVVAGIAHTSDTQTAHIDSVNGVLGELRECADSISELMPKASQASTNLSASSGQLHQLMRYFHC